MSSKKEEKAQVAADRIKAAALSAAKGLSRAQAERAATAAARNVNAYGQKEEGPSRWQERKEAKRQMYLMSTEKAVRLGERKDLKTNISAVGGAASQCQKCFQPGHWTYECKNERVYISRPSRSQILKNPKLRQKLMESYNEDNPDIKREEMEEEKVDKKVEKSDKRKKKSKRKHKSDTESSSDRTDSEASDSDSDSRSSASGSDYSSESASSYSSSSESEDERSRKRRNKKQKGRRKKYSSSSGSSDSESCSDSDSGKNRSKKKHSRRR